MSNNNSMLRAIAGAVLAFYGAKLLGMTLQDKPENYLLFAAIAIVFIAVGTIYAVHSIKNYMKQVKNDKIDDNNSECVKGEDESCE